MELRQQSFSAGLGWFTQSTVQLEPGQVAALRNALGSSTPQHGCRVYSRRWLRPLGSRESCRPIRLNCLKLFFLHPPVPNTLGYDSCALSRKSLWHCHETVHDLVLVINNSYLPVLSGRPELRGMAIEPNFGSDLLAQSSATFSSRARYHARLLRAHRTPLSRT